MGVNTLEYGHLTMERIVLGAIYFIKDTSKYIVKHKLYKLNVKDKIMSGCNCYLKEHKLVAKGMKGYFIVLIWPVCITGLSLCAVSNYCKEKVDSLHINKKIMM